ncbi:MAG: hypothetical protein WBY53_08815 [Acidobacteriaceae bacterium]
MGGHAAIVGAEVYVLQAGTAGYDSTPKNEMTSGEAGSDPTYGNYVLTGANGAFSVTGDYSCVAGNPVYVAAVGGTANTAASLVSITGSTVTNKSGTYTVIFNAANALSSNEPVSFASGAFSTTGYTALNGTTQNVMSATTKTFTIQITTKVATAKTLSATALANGTPNPAITNIAVLGLCPTTGNFSSGTGALSFVYIDEVSTTAAAYALNAFGNGWFAIGAPASNLAGIEHAATNAGQLYNITDDTSANAGGALATTSYVGGGNGVVPQATVNTIANILASCVDSTNTSTTTSDQCSTLFTTATSTGDAPGINPKDISSAAFNIAAFPAGTGTQSGTFAGTLFNLQDAGSAPFTPNLSSAPNDFGIAITYPASLNSHVTNVESVAVDGNGQIWTTAQGDDSITLWSPVGKVVKATTASYAYGYVSIDTSNNAWTGNADSTSGIEEFNNAGTLTNTYGTNYASAYTVIANQTGDGNVGAYFFAGASSQEGYFYFNGYGGFLSGVNGGYTVANNFIGHGALDSAGDLWLTSETGREIMRVVPNLAVFGSGFTEVNKTFPITTPGGTPYEPQPEFPAIDSANDAWIPLQTISSGIGPASVAGLEKVSPTGTVTNYYSGTGTNTATQVYTGANFYQSFGAAVDGSGNIWITNRYNPGLGGSAAAPGASSIIELNSSGTAISPTTNYTYGGILSDCLNIAIDPSGNLWVTNYNGSQLVEVLGAATPVVTPLATAATGKHLGTAP